MRTRFSQQSSLLLLSTPFKKRFHYSRYLSFLPTFFHLCLHPRFLFPPLFLLSLFFIHARAWRRSISFPPFPPCIYLFIWVSFYSCCSIPLVFVYCLVLVLLCVFNFIYMYESFCEHADVLLRTETILPYQQF